MKNGNLYQQLKSARREASIATVQRYGVQAEMGRKIAEAREAIIAKYAPTLNPLKKAEREANSRVWDLGRERHDYGCFNNYDLVHSMAAFMTYVEGERFVVHPIRTANQNKVIMREEIALAYPDMDDMTLMDFVASGDCILLDQGYSNGADLFNYVGEPNYMFGPYNYLKEFANRLVEYRKENGLKDYDMEMEDIYEYMAMFLISHPELVQRNKVSRDRLLLGYVDDFSEDLDGYGDQVTKGCATLELLRRKES